MHDGDYMHSAVLWQACTHIVQATCDQLLLQVAEAVVQDTVLAHQYATAALLESLTVSLTGRSKRGSSSINASDSYIQELVVPLSSARTEIQLQQVIGNVQEQQGRIDYLEQQLLQPNPTAVQQGAVNDAQTSLQNKPQAVKVRADQLARLGRHLAAHRTRSGLPGHTQQLQATWPLQAAPTYEQQAFAAAHAARGLMQLQQSRHEPVLQPVQPLALSMQWCSTPSARASLVETAYWQKVVASPGQRSSNGTRTATELGVRSGHVTAMTASPCTAKLAIGNDQAMVFVFVFAKNRGMTEPARFGGNAAASGGSISGLTWDSSSSHLLSLTAAQAQLWHVPPPFSRSAAHLAATDTPTNALQLLMSLDLEQRTRAQPTLLQPTLDKLSASSAIIWQNQQQMLIWLCMASGAIACLLQPLPDSKTANIPNTKPARHMLQHHKAEVSVVTQLSTGDIVTVDREGYLALWNTTADVVAEQEALTSFRLPQYLVLPYPQGKPVQTWPAGNADQKDAQSTQGMQAWLVQHTRQSAAPAARHVVYSAVPAINQASGKQQIEPLVFSQYAMGTGQLLSQHIQPAAVSHNPTCSQYWYISFKARPGRCRAQVVAGQLLPGPAPLVLILLAASIPSQQQALLMPLHIISCHVVNIAKQQTVGPRIDIWDSSEGRQVPAFTVAQPGTVVGGAVLWVALGQAYLGCYSLTTELLFKPDRAMVQRHQYLMQPLTGQLVREVEVSNMLGSAIAAVHQCCAQHNQYHLCVSSQEQATLSCMQVDDAVASQTVLADTLASMEVQKPGSASQSSSSSSTYSASADSDSSKSEPQLSSSSELSPGKLQSGSLATSTSGGSSYSV